MVSVSTPRLYCVKSKKPKKFCQPSDRPTEGLLRFNTIIGAKLCVSALTEDKESICQIEAITTGEVDVDAIHDVEAASLEEFLRPSVVEALGNARTPAQFGNTVFTAQAIKHKSDFLFSRILLMCRSANVLHNLFGRDLCFGFGSHFGSPYCYDEPEILRCSNQPICPIRLDVRQSMRAEPSWQRPQR